jgi:hypothetical protein
MARVKDQMIEMEDLTWEAYLKGMSLNQTIAYVKRNMKYADTSYIEQVFKGIELERY